jgi:hypothetical protein
MRTFGSIAAVFLGSLASSISTLTVPKLGQFTAGVSIIGARKPLVFFVAALVIYGASTNRVGILGHIPQSPRVHYAYLAEAFLHGRLDLAVTEGEVRLIAAPRAAPMINGLPFPYASTSATSRKKTAVICARYQEEPLIECHRPDPLA